MKEGEREREVWVGGGGGGVGGVRGGGLHHPESNTSVYKKKRI